MDTLAHESIWIKKWEFESNEILLALQSYAIVVIILVKFETNLEMYTKYRIYRKHVFNAFHVSKKLVYRIL